MQEVDARRGTGRHADQWAYLGEATGCRVVAGSIAADLALTQVGRYTIVALAPPPALPALPGNYDEDLTVARRAGAALQQQTIDVP